MSNYLVLTNSTLLRPQAKRPSSIAIVETLEWGNSQKSFYPYPLLSPGSAKDRIMDEACEAWWTNRNEGNEDYTPPWITLPDEINSAKNKSIKKLNFENKSPLDAQNCL